MVKPRKALTSSPTSDISIMPHHHEILLHKRPRREIKIAELTDYSRYSVSAEPPKHGETMNVHTHNDYSKTEPCMIMPSRGDIESLIHDTFIARRRVKLRHHVIAIRQGSQVVGYTFFHFDSKKSEAISKLASRQNMTREHFLKRRAQDYDIITAFLLQGPDLAFKLRLIRITKKWLFFKMGIRLRFVPNRKAGFDLVDGQFLRK